MSEEDLHRRLIVLNTIALLISFKFNTNTSTFSCLLFGDNLRMPKNYADHFDKLSNLTGVALANDSALKQMLHIRTQIDINQIKSKMNIFRCSSECSWLFYIENSTTLDEHKQCPLCKKETSISRNEDLFVMNQPHIPMDQNQTLEFITRYIEDKHYLNLMEKPGHLSQPISYHFINFLINAIFLFLHELNYMSGSTSIIRDYFRKSIETNYTLLRKHLSDSNQSYIWLYKLLNRMIDENITIQDNLQTLQSIISFEKSIEEKLILPHINSVTREIREYKVVYTDFVYGCEKPNQIISFIEELIEDNEQYPLLNFFNVTNIYSIDIIEHFYSELQLQPNYEKTYPLTTFLLKHLSDYDNIPHLYPLIKFTNYLIQKFNYRIEREDAKTIKISQFLKNDLAIKPIYEQFEQAWYKINLKQVYFNQEKYQFQRSESKFDFASQTSISMFLLNRSSTNESILPIACLQTIGNLQNDILDYFHSYVITRNENDHHHMIPLQSIHRKHLFDFDIDRMRKILFETGLMINYKYGMNQEIIYDYDEIEWTLRNEISCLPKIDMKNIRYFNYQFEFYDENMSLINDIRQRFKQKLFEDQKRTEIKRSIDSLDNNSCLEMYGSLEYILTYLRNVNNQNIIEIFTIEKFINEYIHSNACIDKGLFVSIRLEYIIDLYELNEECIFEKILSKNIRNELCEESFPMQEQTKIIQQFIETILHNEALAKSLKDLTIWISMFKRLLVRLLLSKMNINFESSLYDYIKRSDMWKGNISAKDIRTIEIKDDIPLKYAFIILKGLETKLKEQNSNGMQQNAMNNDDDEEEYKQRTSRPTQTTERGQARSRNNLRLAGRQRRT